MPYYHQDPDDPSIHEGDDPEGGKFPWYTDLPVIIETGEIDTNDALNLILRFTQDIRYLSDSESKGQSEYWKFPIETLYDMNGDCEDTSILFCAIIHQLVAEKDYGVEAGLTILPKHMAAGVKIGENSEWLYYETTATNYSVVRSRRS